MSNLSRNVLVYNNNIFAIQLSRLEQWRSRITVDLRVLQCSLFRFIQHTNHHVSNSAPLLGYAHLRTSVHYPSMFRVQNYTPTTAFMRVNQCCDTSIVLGKGGENWFVHTHGSLNNCSVGRFPAANNNRATHSRVAQEQRRSYDSLFRV